MNWLLLLIVFGPAADIPPDGFRAGVAKERFESKAACQERIKRDVPEVAHLYQSFKFRCVDLSDATDEKTDD